MGVAISNLFQRFFGKEEVRILMVGLEAVGKTTILYQLKIGQAITPVPTTSFNVDTVEYKNTRFTVWDVGGQHRLGDLCQHYAVVFVIDASDRERIAEAAEKLHQLMKRECLRNSVLLVMANKQDLPHALCISEVVARMELPKIKQDWHVQATCATSGAGLFEGLECLRAKLVKSKKQKIL